ncbi:MAG TPA: twin-arginine translocase TatA/TatE family subunit [Actinomycetota bacterium]
MNEWVIVGIVAIAVIFGATKLPEIARNLGRSSGEFKKGLKEGDEVQASSPTPTPEAQPPVVAPPAVTPTPAPQPTEPTDPPPAQV